jgi:hypothetical protein
MLAAVVDDGKSMCGPGKSVVMEESEARRLAALGMVILTGEAVAKGKTANGGAGRKGKARQNLPEETESAAAPSVPPGEMDVVPGDDDA